MAEEDVGMLMIKDVFENHRDDYDGAVVKIEEWRGLINILERFVEIAKEHPNGWDHVAELMKKQFEPGETG